MAGPNNHNDKGVVALRRLLKDYETDAETFALLTMGLYEVYDYCNRYNRLYEGLFNLPANVRHKSELLADLLVDAKVLLEEIVFNAAEVTRLVDRFLNSLDDDGK